MQPPAQCCHKPTMTANQSNNTNGEKRTEQLAAQMLADRTVPLAENLLAVALEFDDFDDSDPDIDELLASIADARRDLDALLLLAERLEASSEP
mgnify:FL=1